MNDKASDGVLAAIRATPLPIRYLLGGVALNQLGAFVQTFLVLYLVYRGGSAEVAGLSLVAYSAGSVFGTVLGGELTHRFGPRVTIGLSMAVSGPMVALVPWTAGLDAVWPLMLDVALAGLVTQAYRPAAAVLLSNLMPEKFQVMAFSMMRIALNTGAALGPLLAAVLITVDWDLLFYFDGLTAVLYAALAFTLLPNVPAPAEEKPEPGEVVDRRSAYAVMLRDSRFLMFLASLFLGTIVYTQFFVALPLKIVADHQPVGLYSAVLVTSSVVLITCELKITSYIVKWPPPLAVGLGHAVFALGFLGWWLTSSPVVVVAGSALFVLGLMMSGPSMFARPAKAPARYKARYLGVTHALAGLSGSIAPLLGVLAWNRLGGGIWAVCGLLALAAAVLAYFGITVHAEPEPAAPAEAEPAAPVSEMVEEKA
ncbi:MFS transporter [Saccharothrix variisporea]|uniref:MFS transporter n=1 Tax=Saccharothrix variisporea TaxID=543527 RepID=A0A495XJD2_9PSEU|nr:MFS transporter [Saccharothrix variisporea]RKT74631.1 MFS transporter [Saccharothrix variisporea]